MQFPATFPKSPFKYNKERLENQDDELQNPGFAPIEKMPCNAILRPFKF
jgi:hypothetical protein